MRTRALLALMTIMVFGIATSTPATARYGARPRCSNAPEPLRPPATSVTEAHWFAPGPDWPTGIVADGNLLIAIGEIGDIAAYSMRDGRVLWYTQLLAATKTAPAFGSHVVAVASGPAVSGLNRATGEVVWKHRVKPLASLASVRSPTQELVAIVDSAYQLDVLDMATGSEIWSIDFKDSSVFQMEVNAAPDGLFVSLIGRDSGRVLIALDPGTGAERWRVDLPRHTPFPLVAAGRVVVAEAGRSPALVARDARRGDVQWRVGLPGPISQRLAPGTDGRHVAVMDRCGTVTFVDAQAGIILWQSRVDIIPPDLTMYMTATRVAFVTLHSVVMFDRATGRSGRFADPFLDFHNLVAVEESFVMLFDFQDSGSLGRFDWLDMEAVPIH